MTEGDRERQIDTDRQRERDTVERERERDRARGLNKEMGALFISTQVPNNLNVIQHVPVIVDTFNPP